MKPYHSFFFNKHTITFLLTVLSNVLFAQKNASRSDFVADVLHVKLKQTHRYYFTNPESLQGFNTLIAPVVLEKADRLFPNSVVPVQEDHVDLTRIYSLTFSGIDKSALMAFATQLLSYGAFEYAEVKYLESQHSMLVPNDPYAAVNNYQRYFSRMQLYEAWALQQSNPSVIIGIVDTGLDYTHEDLIGNIAYNIADPINGIDDDKDGFIDNYYGWDLANNDNNPIPPSNSAHGTIVAGIAGATPNNARGMAGVGYHSKLLPIKASPDGNSAIVKGYEGIVYGADHGCKVINLSWGGAGNYSAVGQDVINYAAINKDVLLVAAAGNTDEEADYYPAAYDHVLSVIAMDTVFSPSAGKYIETRATFKNWVCCYKATYAHSVDIGAQGFGILSTKQPNTYTAEDGSSAASPIVAGAAGIVRAHYPKFTALQTAELLRVTADVVDTFPENAAYKEKMGKGRINVYKALTDTQSPAVRMTSKQAFNNFGAALFNGDTVSLVGEFWNYLRTTADLTIDLSSTSTSIKLLNNSFHAGIIDSMTGTKNTASPFTFVILSSATNNQVVEFRIGYSDPVKKYTDYQYFKLLLNPSYITLSNDTLRTTITSNGRYGYVDINSTIGTGFEKKGSNMLYEAGLLVGFNSTKLSDCVRGLPGGNNNLNFKPLNNAHFVPSAFAYKETFSKYNDSALNNNNPIGIEILQTSYTFNTAPLTNTVFMQYKIINKSGNDFDSLYAGNFIDWDVQNYLKNKADFSSTDRLGYTYNSISNNLFAGISLLTDQEVNYYAMDNYNAGGNNINPNGPFNKTEKFKSISSGIARTQAGVIGGGNDVSMVMAGRINQLKKGDTAVIAFALITANSLSELKMYTSHARNKFIELNTGPTPEDQTYNLCSNDTAPIVIQPSKGKTFNFYDTVPTINTLPVYSGKTFTISTVFKADTIYITNIDSLYESAYARFSIKRIETPTADFTASPSPATLPSSFLNQSIGYTSLEWDFGDGTKVIDVEKPSHTYINTGDYEIVLVAKDAETCSDTIKKTITIPDQTTSILNSLVNESIRIYPLPVQDRLHFDVDLTRQTADILIANALGQIVLRKPTMLLNASGNELDVSLLSPGFYFLMVKTQTHYLTIRFIKE